MSILPNLMQNLIVFRNIHGRWNMIHVFMENWKTQKRVTIFEAQAYTDEVSMWRTRMCKFQ